MMANFKLVVRSAIVALLLVVHEPSSKLASGQLEAVGAIMSVVPMTSILATAGLVGVKLVALSRLLDVLGYDRAYLAQGGSGTAAQPIGLQTKYAYMFPYVPGLNISVSGEDSFGLREPALESKTEAHRKTYPAMGLPGDYEKIQRPFRGSEALQDVFKQAGIKAHFLTPQQQQQVQQQFNLPPQEPTHTDKHLNNNNQNKQQPSQTLPPPLPPLPPPVQPQTHPQPDSQPNLQPQPHDLPQPPPPSLHVVPSNVVPGRRDPNAVNQHHNQLANEQSSSSSHSHQVPASHLQHQHQQHQADAVAQHQFASTISAAVGHLSSGPSPLSFDDDVEPDQHLRPNTQPTLSQLHWVNHAIIPQRDEFHRRVLASRLHHQQPDSPVVQIGHLSHPENSHTSENSIVSVAPSGGIQAIELIPSNLPTNKQHPAPQNLPMPHLHHSHAHVHHNPPPPAHLSPHPFNSFSAVPESFRPPQVHEGRHPFPWQHQPPPPTPASQANGFSALPNEMTTNFFPRPFDTDDFPTTLSDDGHSNELDRIHHGRRRKRTTDLSERGPPSSAPWSEAARSIIGATPAVPQQASQSERSAVAQTFGMPALNIHALKRRRRKRDALLAAASRRRLT